MPTLPRGYIKIKKTPDGVWYDLPDPAEDGVTYEIQTIVDDARNAQGTFIGSPIGQDKIKLNVSYPPLTDEQLNDILSIFDRENGGSYKVYVNFYDPRVRQRVTRYMYVGDRSFQPVMVKEPTYGEPTYWTNVQCNLIEC